MSLCQCVYNGTNNVVTENLEKSKTNSEDHIVALVLQSWTSVKSSSLTEREFTTLRYDYITCSFQD
jgi:hypothetical protein